jgi:hypothetical protein
MPLTPPRFRGATSPRACGERLKSGNFGFDYEF